MCSCVCNDIIPDVWFGLLFNLEFSVSPVLGFVHLDVVIPVLATQIFSGSTSRD